MPCNYAKALLACITKPVKRWPNGLASQRTQVCKTRTCVRTCDGWPNGFASPLASSRTYDQLVPICVGWPNGMKELTSTWFELDQRRCKYKLMQVHASPRKYVESNLRWLASPFGQGFSILPRLKFCASGWRIFNSACSHQITSPCLPFSLLSQVLYSVL